MNNHNIDEAAYLVRYGDSSCLCKNCYMLIEGLQAWITNSKIDASYTEDDAVRDFWEDWDTYGAEDWNTSGKKYMKELEIIQDEVY